MRALGILACLVLGCGHHAGTPVDVDDAHSMASGSGDADGATERPPSGPSGSGVQIDVPDAPSDASIGSPPDLDAPSNAPDVWTSTPATDAAGGSEPDAGTGKWIAYASGYGPNIQLFDVDPQAGTLTLKVSLPAFGTSPSFLAIGNPATQLYAIDENATGRVGAYSADPQTGELTFLNAVSSGGQGPAYVSTDRSGKYVFVPNYTNGSVAVVPVLAGGHLGPMQQLVSVGVNPHMMIADPSNHYVFVPCKGSDYIAQFTFDATSGTIAPNPAGARIATAAMAGPRHLAFHPTAPFVYLVNETNSTISAYAFDPTTGTLGLPPIDTQSTIAAGVIGNTAAEVWVHPSGRWVVASNRGENSLAVFAIDAATGKMTFTERTSSGGTGPRDFTFDATGTFVYAANQTSNDVVTFRFDVATGGLTQVGAPLAATGASFIGLTRIAGP